MCLPGVFPSDSPATADEGFLGFDLKLFNLELILQLCLSVLSFLLSLCLDLCKVYFEPPFMLHSMQWGMEVTYDNHTITILVIFNQYMLNIIVLLSRFERKM